MRSSKTFAATCGKAKFDDIMLNWERAHGNDSSPILSCLPFIMYNAASVLDVYFLNN
jgi:hypothetical protein